jgi:hypothetical protein
MQAVQRGAPPVLRLYTWQPACLSFGRNQHTRGVYDPGSPSAPPASTWCAGPPAAWPCCTTARSPTPWLRPPTCWAGRAAYLAINHALVEGCGSLGVPASVAGRPGRRTRSMTARLPVSRRRLPARSWRRAGSWWAAPSAASGACSCSTAPSWWTAHRIGRDPVPARGAARWLDPPGPWQRHARELLGRQPAAEARWRRRWRRAFVTRRAFLLRQARCPRMSRHGPGGWSRSTPARTGPGGADRSQGRPVMNGYGGNGCVPFSAVHAADPVRRGPETPRRTWPSPGRCTGTRR